MARSAPLRVKQRTCGRCGHSRFTSGFTLDVGKDTDGRRIQQKRTGFPTKVDAERGLHEVEALPRHRLRHLVAVAVAALFLLWPALLLRVAELRVQPIIESVLGAVERSTDGVPPGGGSERVRLSVVAAGYAAGTAGVTSWSVVVSGFIDSSEK